MRTLYFRFKIAALLDTRFLLDFFSHHHYYEQAFRNAELDSASHKQALFDRFAFRFKIATFLDVRFLLDFISYYHCCEQAFRHAELDSASQKEENFGTFQIFKLKIATLTIDTLVHQN